MSIRLAAGRATQMEMAEHIGVSGISTFRCTHCAEIHGRHLAWMNDQLMRLATGALPDEPAPPACD